MGFLSSPNVNVILLIFSSILLRHAASDCVERTSFDDEGPFYVKGVPTRATLIPESSIENLAQRGELLELVGTVKASCPNMSEPAHVPVQNVFVDIWHAGDSRIAGTNHRGGYSWRDTDKNYWFRGRQATLFDGSYSFLTQFPTRYSGRPIRHIHVKLYYYDDILHPGTGKPYTKTVTLLTTQIYFDGMVPQSFQDHVFGSGGRASQVVAMSPAAPCKLSNEPFCPPAATTTPTSTPSKRRVSFDIVLNGQWSEVQRLIELQPTSTTTTTTTGTTQRNTTSSSPESSTAGNDWDLAQKTASSSRLASSGTPGRLCTLLLFCGMTLREAK